MSMVGENIKRIRKQLHMSQKQLSIRANISQSGISDIENSTRSPSIDTIRMIADALGVSQSMLLGEEQEKPAQEKGRQELLSQIDIKFSQLPQDLKMQAMAYVAGRIASRKDQ